MKLVSSETCFTNGFCGADRVAAGMDENDYLLGGDSLHDFLV